MENNKHKQQTDKSPVEVFMYRYLPYWPLFILLIVVAGAASVFYISYFAKPVYEVSAKVLVEDEKKGADESKLMQALNISSSTIVDNEIEVIQSKHLLTQVADSLRLYAPISEKGTFTSYAAYTSSPVIITAKSAADITPSEPVMFSFDAAKQQVNINGKFYPLATWLKTPYGKLMFTKNPHYKKPSEPKPLFFTLNNIGGVVDGLYAKLLVTPASKLSSVILLSLNDEVPERGRDILDLLISFYYQSAVDSKNALAANTLDFVQERIQAVATELDSIENRLQHFKNQKGVVNLGEQSKLYLQNVGENDRKVTDIDMQLAMLNEVERYVANKDGQMGIVPSFSAIKDQQFLSGLVQKLYDSQIQYEKLKKTIPAGNPGMFSLKNEIDNMRPAILENIQNQRAGLLAGRNSLSTGTGRYVSMLNSIPQKEKELLDISRQQAIKNDAYSFLLQKREEAALAYSSITGNNKNITAATATFDPVGPKKTFIYSSCLAMALLLGFAFVHIKESATNKVLFRSDIERISAMPVMGEIMSIKSKEPLLLSGKHVDQLGCIEQFRQLRFTLGLNGRQPKLRRLLVTSSEAGEGKSFISNNLALSLTNCDKRVVLIDFDFRNPKTSTLFKLQDNIGLSEYFDSDNLAVDEIIYPTEKRNLFVVPAGALVSNPTELLLKKDLNELFTRLEEKFDFVLMDTPPVDPVIDASIVSEYCDAMLFVVRHGFSSKSTLESLQQSRKLSADKPSYIVFNGIKSRGFLNNKYGLGYGYGTHKMYGNDLYQLAAANVQSKNV